MLYEQIPIKEYATLADRFDPIKFDAKEWVRQAKKAGMKYIVYTTKHHDGFAMYDSQCSDYNIVKRTPYGKDPLRELAEECKKQGLKLGLYYSWGRDWEDPDVPTNWPKKAGRSNTWDFPDEDGKVLDRYIQRKAIPQIKELLTNYGKIDIIWFDTPGMITEEQSMEMRKVIEDLQPNCLINSRIGNGKGDYNNVEQQLTNKINRKPWEVCLTMGRNWGYNKFDKTYKSPEEMIRHLADIVSKGGNLLLNIGPNGKGEFPALTKPILKEYSSWLSKNGEAIYGTRPWIVATEILDEKNAPEERIIDTELIDSEFDGTPKDRTPDFRFTSKGENIYVIARDVVDKEYIIKTISPNIVVKAVKLLETGKAVEWEQTPKGLKIKLDKSFKTKSPIYVLKLEV